MERIGQTQFFAEPERALERARAKGETLEITADGRTIARLVPEPEQPKRAPLKAGGSKGKIWFTDPADSLDDLWSPDHIAEWNNSDVMGN